jgi:hypothetical protein
MMDFGPLRQVDAFFNGDFKGPLADWTIMLKRQLEEDTRLEILWSLKRFLKEKRLTYIQKWV